MMILKANHIPETHQGDHSVPFELMFFALLFLFCLVLISHLHMELFRGEILVETDFMRSDLSIPWKRWLLMSYFVFHLKCTRPCAWECQGTIGSTIHYRLVRHLVFPQADDGFCLHRINWGTTLRISAYLPGSGDTLISKEVPPGRGLSIALRLGWPLRFPQMWETREHNLWELGTAFALSPYKIWKAETQRNGSILGPLPPLLYFEYCRFWTNIIHFINTIIDNQITAKMFFK